MDDGEEVNHLNDENYEEIYGLKWRPNGRPRMMGGMSCGFLGDNNPASTVTEKRMAKIKRIYGLPLFSWADIPCKNQRANWDIYRAVCFYEVAFEIGLRLPLPIFVVEVLSYYHIAPSQLMPNSWRIILGLQVLSEREGINVSVDTLRHSYQVKEHDHDKGRYQLSLKAGFVPLVILPKWNERPEWKHKYFMVHHHYVFGTTVRGKVPTYWSRVGQFPKENLPRSVVEDILKVPEARREVRTLLAPRSLSQTSIWWTAIMESGGCEEAYLELVGESECQDSDLLLQRYKKKRKERPSDSVETSNVARNVAPKGMVQVPPGQVTVPPSVNLGNNVVELSQDGPTICFGSLTLCHGKEFKADNLDGICQNGVECVTSYAIENTIKVLQSVCISHHAVEQMQKEILLLRKRNAELEPLVVRVEEAEKEALVAKQNLTDAKKEFSKMVRKTKLSGEHQVILTKRQFAVNAIEGRESTTADYEDLVEACDAYLRDHEVPIPSGSVRNDTGHGGGVDSLSASLPR